MAVDCLRPVHGDLPTVLATLRYRLQPHPAAADLQIDQAVPPLPPLADLSAHTVLQIQRIVLEAFTNLLKHAQATRLQRSAEWRAAGPAAGPEGARRGPAGASTLSICIELSDNGIDLPAALATPLNGWGPVGHGPGGNGTAVQDHGLTHMHTRAQSIGAVLRVLPGLNGGKLARMVLPVTGGVLGIAAGAIGATGATAGSVRATGA